MADEPKFRARAPDIADRSSAKADQTAQILADLKVLAADAEVFRAVGRQAFLGEEGALYRHAADGILIKVQELCDRLPTEFRERHPDVPWAAIRGIRNRLGHNYRETNYAVVWVAVTDRVPELVEAITRPTSSN